METVNGHPIDDGYFVIGHTIARQIESLFLDPPSGFVYRRTKPGNKPEMLFAENRRYWVFASPQTARANGWDLKKRYTLISYRDLSGYEYMGLINQIDPNRFGP